MNHRLLAAASGGVDLNPEHWFVSFVSTPFGGGVVFVLALVGALVVWKHVKP